MKHTKHILLMVALLLGSLSVSAEVVQIDGIWYNIVKKAAQAEVVYDSNSDAYYSGNIIIPSVVEYEGVECSVTSIGDDAFYGCRNLASITIPKSVTTIGGRAFYGCTSLTSITIPENVTSIGYEAFSNCWGFTSITIPESVTSIGNNAFSYCTKLASITLSKSITSIGDYVFQNCSSLTAIIIPDGVTSIGNRSFEGCGSLNSITIPKSVTLIGDNAFHACSSLTSIIIPESVTEIGGYAFHACSSLTSITIPESVTHIGEVTFCECSSLTSITIPESVISIGHAAFNSCSGLTSIIIPESVTEIGGYAFYGCSSLTSITIPESVKIIDSGTFKDCVNLVSVVLPRSITDIEGSAFANCESLLDVYCYAGQVPSAAESIFENSYPEYITLHVPTKSLNDYKATAPWSSFGKFETIETPIFSITLSETSLPLTVGDVWQLSVTDILPENATDKSVIWSSSNLNAAIVDEGGRVQAIAPGTATITATANDGSGVSASCEVIVVEEINYSLTFMVDGQVFQTETSETPIEVVFPEAPEKEGHSFVRWELSSSDATLTEIDIANNADAMLYSNAPCTNTKYGDQFTSWDVLFDDDYNTFFHSEYSEGVDSEDGLDHYLRVDMGEGNSVDQFAFSYAMRGDQYPNHTPTKIIVEGSNEANGKYDTIAVLTDLAEPPYDIDYTSEILGNGKEYRYIRYRVAQTLMNSLVCGHPYFYISEFGMKKAQDCYNTVYRGVYAPKKYKVYYYVGEELLDYVEVTYGDQMPNMVYFPALDTEEFLGWVSETGDTYETMPAHDVIYVANIRTYEKCATPTIRYADGRVTFLCETEGVEFTTRVIEENRRSYRTDSEGFEFVPTYTFTTRATKEGCIDSDDVSVTICWIDCTGEHEAGDDDTDIISVPSQPVIIQCANGVITLTGLSDGTAVAVYDTAGMGYGTAVAENGAATIATNLEAGNTAIVKIGERSVKVAVK